MDDLVEFYRELLPMASLTSNSEGRVKVKFGDMSQDFLVGSSPLLLPTPQVIDRLNSGCVIFHPLSELIQKGEGDVHAAFRKAANITLNATLRLVILSLISAAKNKAKELEQIPHSHLGLLGLLKDADEKMYDNVSKMFKKIPLEDVTRSLINIYMKTNAKIDGTDYRRGAIVSFPFYNELVSKPESLFGTNMRKTMDPQALRGLLEYIFPDIKNDGMYSGGSMSDHYPTFDAFLRAMYKVWLKMNSIIEVVGVIDPELKESAVSLGWKGSLDNNEKLVYWSKRVPTQPGANATPQEAVAQVFNKQQQQQPSQPFAQQTQTPAFNRPNQPESGGLAAIVNKHFGGNNGGPMQQQNRFMQPPPQNQFGGFPQNRFQQQQRPVGFGQFRNVSSDGGF